MIFAYVMFGVVLDELVRAIIWYAQYRKQDKLERQKREAKEARIREQEERIARKQLFWRNMKETSRI